jgi:hypothetical protein
MKNALRWLVVPLAILLVGVGVVLALGAAKAFPGLLPFGSQSENRNTQVINSVTRTEQVVLVSLGIQGISEKNAKSTFLGVDIPGSERASFIMYSFNAKLGVEGKDVRVSQAGENEFLVSIPKFIFIGHDKETFRVAAQGNGALSWVTPQIDNVEMVNNILNDDAQAQYLESNKAILQDQAKSFYAGIITSIDPTLSLKFEFR